MCRAHSPRAKTGKYGMYRIDRFVNMCIGMLLGFVFFRIVVR